VIVVIHIDQATDESGPLGLLNPIYHMSSVGLRDGSTERPYGSTSEPALRGEFDTAKIFSDIWRVISIHLSCVYPKFSSL
jgi:hypothetical protein